MTAAVEMFDPTSHIYMPDLAFEDKIESEPVQWREEILLSAPPGLTRMTEAEIYCKLRCWDPLGLGNLSPRLEAGLQSFTRTGDIEAAYGMRSKRLAQPGCDDFLPAKVSIDLWPHEAMALLNLRAEVATLQSEVYQYHTTAMRSSFQHDNQHNRSSLQHENQHNQLHTFFKRGSSEIFSNDHRSFTKKAKGRLSVVSESRLHSQGIVQYLVQFTCGELSNADGVGLVFSPRIPVTSDLHKITSIFLNRTGRICKRTNEHVERIPIRLAQIEVGDWIEIVNDLDAQTVTFTIRPASGQPESSAIVCHKVLGKIPAAKVKSPSFLAVVVKNPQTTVRLLS